MGKDRREEHMHDCQDMRDMRTGRKFRVFISVVMIILILAAGLWFYKHMKKDVPEKNLGEEIMEELVDAGETFASEVIIGHEGELSVITETTLEEVFEINELSTADYTYNAIVTAYDAENVNAEYYVSYNGKVTAGIDFSEINYYVDDDEKMIYIKVPECTIQECVVDYGSMEYIFANKKAETETVSATAYKLCEEDLKKRAENDNQLIALAKANAEDAVKALVEPWAKQLGYKMTIQGGAENEDK